MQRIIIKTHRLKIRKFCDSDLHHLTALDSNIEVMKYIGDGSIMTAEQVKNVLDSIISKYHSVSGFGVWAAEIQDTKEFIGWFSLKNHTALNEIERGYRFIPKYWGKGYATEGSLALLKYGFNNLGLFKIIGVVHPENEASRNVLKKIGLKFEKSLESEQRHPKKIEVYSMTVEEYLSH